VSRPGEGAVGNEVALLLAGSGPDTAVASLGRLPAFEKTTLVFRVLPSGLEYIRALIMKSFRRVQSALCCLKITFFGIALRKDYKAE
jgi:hypothetical protein